MVIFSGFEFESAGGVSNLNQRLKCQVTVCHIDVCDSACKQGCFADNSCTVLPSIEAESTNQNFQPIRSFVHAQDIFQNSPRNNRKKQWLAFLKATNTAFSDPLCPLH